MKHGEGLSLRYLRSKHQRTKQRQCDDQPPQAAIQS
jgi:hypothetical protein